MAWPNMKNRKDKKLIKTINFPPLGDDRGHLVSLEGQDTVPFEIKRVYYLFDTKENVSRGYHAHKDLEQIAICVKGSCKFILDDGYQRDEILLSNATVGLYIGSLVWREMHDFTSDCVLLVLASQNYNEYDYIRDYQEFTGLIHASNK